MLYRKVTEPFIDVFTYRESLVKMVFHELPAECDQGRPAYAINSSFLLNCGTN